MLQIETPFPNPGSIALHCGQSWRVMQHIDGGLALLSLIGSASGRYRRAPLDELIDPAEAEENAALPFTDREEADRRRALWIARYARDKNEVSLIDLNLDLDSAAREGKVPVCHDRAHLARLLRKLGWQRRRVESVAQGGSWYARIASPPATSAIAQGGAA
jgi:hypothetical protein